MNDDNSGDATDLTATIACFLDQLRPHLPTDGQLGVAFSGGVDSTVLAKAAAMILGADRVVAIIGVSPSLAPQELAESRQLASSMGVDLVEVTTREVELEAYRQNGADRCFHCKNELFTRIGDAVVTSLGLGAVAYGEIADDASRADRPGSAAADLHGVLRPLAAAGMTKLQVREFAFAVGLPNWDKPAAPCLASRIPFNSEVTPRKLEQVGRLEAVMRDWGFRELRVRHHGPIARIEVPAHVLPDIAREPWRSRTLEAGTEAGFDFVVLDLAGLRSGLFAQLEIIGSGDGRADV